MTGVHPVWPPYKRPKKLAASSGGSEKKNCRISATLYISFDAGRTGLHSWLPSLSALAVDELERGRVPPVTLKKLEIQPPSPPQASAEPLSSVLTCSTRRPH